MRSKKKVFEDLTFENNEANITFPNGYSAKVTIHRTLNPYQIECIPVNQQISDEPIAYLTQEEVTQIMKEIQSLRPL